MADLAAYRRRNPTRSSVEPSTAPIFIVIPAYRESEFLPAVLRSLRLEAHPNVCCVVVVNNEADAPTDVVADNQRTAELAESLGATVLDYFSTDRAFAPSRGGVGAARRAGMDWVVARARDEAVILVSLDADSPADPGFLDALGGFTGSAGLVHFEHDIPGDNRGGAIVAYETWLRYIARGFAWAGSPFCYPALGSIIVCTVGAYVSAAGMPTRRGGEDFHFIQKLVKTSGPLLPIAATVRPSARVSDRVPFGTGPAIAATIGGESDYTHVVRPEAFEALRDLIDAIPDLHASAAPLSDLHQLLQIDEPALDRIRKQHPTPAAFERAFHEFFDGLRSRQFLRRHTLEFGRMDVRDAVAAIVGISADLDPTERLLALRVAD